MRRRPKLTQNWIAFVLLFRVLKVMTFSFKSSLNKETVCRFVWSARANGWAQSNVCVLEFGFERQPIRKAVIKIYLVLVVSAQCRYRIRHVEREYSTCAPQTHIHTPRSTMLPHNQSHRLGFRVYLIAKINWVDSTTLLTLQKQANNVHEQAERIIVRIVRWCSVQCSAMQCKAMNRG